MKNIDFYFSIGSTYTFLSVVIDNEIFWGDDRMEDAIKWLKKDVS